MINFRRVITVLAVLALFAGLSMATASPPAVNVTALVASSLPAFLSGTTPALAPAITVSPPDASVQVTLTAATLVNAVTASPTRNLAMVNNSDANTLVTSASANAIDTPSATAATSTNANLAQGFPPGANQNVVTASAGTKLGNSGL